MNEHQTIRVRFAPSPTGYLHIGGARTALFNWLFARHKRGCFVLRIESTDKVRSTQESVDEIIESMKWLGLSWDEGPFFQHERIEIYKKFAQKLVDEEKAYISSEVRGEHPAVIFKVPKKTVEFKDIIYGTIQFDTANLEDIVLIKSDGMPTYNFACVVDDVEMKISHVIRGDDHISNTPKQLLLYEALDFTLPLFAHVPMILGGDGARLSKRHNAVSMESYKKEGYLPETVVNYLALLGWSPGNDRELMSIDELIGAFTLEKVSKKSAIFDNDKLRWINGQYIKVQDDKVLYPYFKPYFNKEIVDEGKGSKIVSLLKERIKTLSEIEYAIEYFISDEIKYEDKACRKYLAEENVLSLLSSAKEVLERIPEDNFNEQSIEESLRSLIDALQIKAGALIHPLRVALTGRAASPGLFEVIEVLGKTKSVKRIQNAVEKVEKGIFA